METVTWPREPLEVASAVAALAALANAPTRSADTVTILRDGAAAFPAMLELIESATRELQFENFIFAGDATGKRFAAALSGAARRGVQVRVLYDPVGTLMVRGGSIARTLRNDGVTTRAFRPLSPFAPWTWSRIRHRDHRKTLVVDDHSCVVGGLCISDNWSPSSQGGQAWRDTALLVRGPVARDVRSEFEQMWRHPPQHAVAASVEPRSETLPPATLVVADHPGAERVAQLYGWLAERAQQSIAITDAYMVLPRALVDALRAAASRGVSVQMLLPGRNNHPLAGAAARHGYETLLEAGVEIWEWSGVMVHAKTAVVDRELSLVGSSNLDPLSMRRNYELNLVVADAKTGADMHQMFLEDLATATRVDLELWRRRPRWQRFSEAVGALFSPTL